MDRRITMDFEFKDSVNNFDSGSIPFELRILFWAWFDANQDKQFKLKWGWFRPSFRIGILEPLFIQIIGVRPT